MNIEYQQIAVQAASQQYKPANPSGGHLSEQANTVGLQALMMQLYSGAVLESALKDSVALKVESAEEKLTESTKVTADGEDFLSQNLPPGLKEPIVQGTNAVLANIITSIGNGVQSSVTITNLFSLVFGFMDMQGFSACSS